MAATLAIEDTTIWFKHIGDPQLRSRLGELGEGEAIHLVTDGIVGRWTRMRRGKDGRVTYGIKPEGEMKTIWGDWFRNRKGSMIPVQEVHFADDFLKEGSLLFSEWLSPEDEEAFGDL